MSNNDGAGEALPFVTVTIWNGRLLLLTVPAANPSIGPKALPQYLVLLCAMAALTAASGDTAGITGVGIMR